MEGERRHGGGLAAQVTVEEIEALRWFKAAEFHHPDLVDHAAALFLDQLREHYGHFLWLTSDARTKAENSSASGSSPTSLHLLGRAFDLRWPGDEERMWQFLEGFFLTLGWTPPITKPSVELELVHSATDKHIHFGLFPNDRPSRLIVAAD